MMTRFLILLLLLTICCSTAEVARAEQKAGIFSSLKQKLFGSGRKNARADESARAAAPGNAPLGEKDGTTSRPAAGNNSTNGAGNSRRGAMHRLGWGSHSPSPLVTTRPKPTGERQAMQPPKVVKPARPVIATTNPPAPKPASRPTFVEMSPASRGERSPVLERKPETSASVSTIDRKLDGSLSSAPTREVANGWLSPPSAKPQQRQQHPLTLSTRSNFADSRAVEKSSPPTVLQNPYDDKWERRSLQGDSAVQTVSFEVPVREAGRSMQPTAQPDEESDSALVRISLDDQEKDAKEARRAAEAEEAPEVFRRIKGSVIDVDPRNGLIRVRLEANTVLPEGEQLQIVGSPQDHRSIKAMAVVTAVADGLLEARVKKYGDLEPTIRAGDRVVAWQLAENE